MTAVTPGWRPRAAQLAATIPPTPQVMTWRPMAAAAAGAVALVATGTQAHVPLRLSIAGAWLAASAAYVIDDPGAVTVASAPTGLFARRAVRTAAAVAATSVGWIAALLVSSLRVDAIAVRPATLEAATLVVVALAVSAVAATVGGGTEGAIAGVVATMICFGSTFLPGPRWLPFPADPAAPGAAGRLLLVLSAAAAVLALESRDPAASRRRTRRAPHRHPEPGGSS